MEKMIKDVGVKMMINHFHLKFDKFYYIGVMNLQKKIF